MIWWVIGITVLILGIIWLDWLSSPLRILESKEWYVYWCSDCRLEFEHPGPEVSNPPCKYCGKEINDSRRGF